jgi:hypothetical protein
MKININIGDKMIGNKKELINKKNEELKDIELIQNLEKLEKKELIKISKDYGYDVNDINDVEEIKDSIKDNYALEITRNNILISTGGVRIEFLLCNDDIYYHYYDTGNLEGKIKLSKEEGDLIKDFFYIDF